MRNAILVDAAYLLKAAPDPGVDYKRLIDHLEERLGAIAERHYFNSTPDPASDAQNAFHNWLKSARPRGPNFRAHLFKLKSMNIRCNGCGAEFERTVQKGVDVGLATHAIKLAHQGRLDRCIVLAGDGDFEDALAYIRDTLGKELYVLGFNGSLSTDLQSLADETIFLDDLMPDIQKSTRS